MAPGLGADEDDPGLGQRARKGFALGQESIAGMHRLSAGLAAGLDDLLHHQIAFGRCRGPDQNASSAISTWSASRSAFGIDGHGLDNPSDGQS